MLSGPGAVLTQTDSVVSATGATAGQIEISGSGVALGGLLDASASGRRASGGAITVTAEGMLSLGGTVRASATQGAGGTVRYSAGRVLENSSGITDVRGLSDGGTISGLATGDYATSGTYLADGLFGKGGRIDLTGGANVSLLGTRLLAGGRSMGGLVRVGGQFQGGKAFEGTNATHDTFIGRWGTLPALASARSLFVNDSTLIDVTASHGAGGSAVLWSDQVTTFLGNIDARGAYGPGSVEVSSAEDLRYVSLDRIVTGPGGTLLLDPKNITVGTAAEAATWAYSGILRLANASGVQPWGLRTYENLGRSVALSDDGKLMAIGSPGDAGNFNALNSAGAVYLFSFADGNFSGGTLQSILGYGYTGGNNYHFSDMSSEFGFGTAVALNGSGNLLAASKISSIGRGGVYLFSFSDNFATPVLRSKITYDALGPNDLAITAMSNNRFGTSLALNGVGDRLAVGSSHHASTTDVGNAGAVYLYSFSDANFSSGKHVGTMGHTYTGPKDVSLTDFDISLDINNYFGSSVAFNADGSLLAVGASGDTGLNGTADAETGAVFLFQFDQSVTDGFGSGELRTVIGSGYGAYSGGLYTGYNATLSTGVSNNFGYSVAFNNVGDRLVVGAFGDRGASNGSTRYGAVNLFTFTDAIYSNLAFVGKISAGYTGSGDFAQALDADDLFGMSVALNGAGDRMVVGASGDDGYGNVLTNSGTA